uniref:GRF-type domain-containing protein n=1 Tax=Chenopodium quinoa TaxID=63459 RepID=A0A803L2Q7_CHEQI
MRQHSSGSSSSSNSRGVADPVIKCNCGRNVVPRTVKKGVNVGRKFYGCPFWLDTQCAMFRWISDINDGEDV